VNKKTNIEDHTGARIELHGGTDLSASEYVEVRGLEAAALHLTAARLERRAPRDEVWVRGIVREISPPNFKVQGVPVTTSASTVFQGVGSAAQFFLLLVPGRVVKVQGALVDNCLAAREVEFEVFDGVDGMQLDGGRG
jgi:hypothetical protein